MASDGLCVLAKEVVKTLKTPGGNPAREASARARHVRSVPISIRCLLNESPNNVMCFINTLVLYLCATLY